LVEELRARNRDLTEALEQPTATAEILRVISQSQTDVQPVFDTIAHNAVRLCTAAFSYVFRFDGQLMHVVAHHNVSEEGLAALARQWPMAPNRRSIPARAVLDRVVVHVTDALEEQDYLYLPTARALGLRTLMAVPMLRDGRPVGAIAVCRQRVEPFSDRQIDLVKTFADQAVIAIENVRLFNETKEALDRQTATSEILQVISSSPTDVYPVFETIARSATNLCEAELSHLYRFDEGLIHFAAQHGGTPAETTAAQRAFPQPPSRLSVTARAILTAAIVQVADVSEEPDVADSLRMFRTVLSVPMLRDRRTLGAITVARRVVRPFTAKQIDLLKTFADQAAIAIENVRLFNELEEKNRALTQTHSQMTEALEQQTATAEILRVISSSPTDVQPVFDAIVRSASQLCGGEYAIVTRYDGQLLHLAAQYNPRPGTADETARYFPQVPRREALTPRAFIDAHLVHAPDVDAEDLEPSTREFYRRIGLRAVLAVPMIHEGRPIGVVSVSRGSRGPFADRQITLLQTFADQAVIAIENVRLFKELEARNRDLTEALSQQTATADILRVISSSPTGIQPTFEAIAAAATTLCEADHAALFRFDGDLIHFVAQHGRTPEEVEAATRAFPQPPRRHSVTGRAILGNAVVQIADASQDPELEELIRLHRTMLSVPLIRDGRSLGAITLARRVVKAFTEHQIALLKTFADQAVIAIENVRLFTELQARTQELTRSVEQLTALGEVGQAITSTLDLQTVLSTIVARATQLTGVDAGIIYEYDAERELFEPRATERLEDDIVQLLEATPIRKGQGATGRLAESAEPMQVADLRDVATQIPARDALVRGGYRAVLAVPLVREGHLIGGLTVFRKTPGEFALGIVDLLRTFATQSALAIQNARLFREIADKSRQLEVASQHKSEFLANMSHELRTPLNAIIGFSEVLSERMFGELNEKQEEYLKDIYASGTHLLSLINDILDLSKIEAGRMELELTDFDLPAAIDNALVLVRERAGRRSITLHTVVDQRLGQIRADERKVRQVILNLLSNAIKFTPEGGRIEVGAMPKDGSVEVSVSDTGVGIAPEDQEAVFEEFRQVGTAAKKVEGTGLGLTLCRKFIELHGGRIWVRSQVDVGSTFTFAIPVRRGE
jgi:two-component system, NtrC family, sensor kinase